MVRCQRRRRVSLAALAAGAAEALQHQLVQSSAIGRGRPHEDKGRGEALRGVGERLDAVKYLAWGEGAPSCEDGSW